MTVVNASLSHLDHELAEALAVLGVEMRRRMTDRTDVGALRTRADGDVTHAFDQFAEDTLLRVFEASGLPIRFSSEERDDIDLGNDPRFVAIVDPLDGSDMLARGYPLASISVSVVEIETATPVLSRIVEVATGAQYATGVAGPTRNGLKVAPSSVRGLRDAFVVSYLATGVRLADLRARPTDIAWPKLFLNYGGGLDIAKVGSGQCDAVAEFVRGFKAWDYVAGLHFARSAGAVASTLDGREVPISTSRDARIKFVVAGTPELLVELLQWLDRSA